jgi:hypothetical protein
LPKLVASKGYVTLRCFVGLPVNFGDELREVAEIHQEFGHLKIVCRMPCSAHFASIFENRNRSNNFSFSWLHA